MIFCKLRKIVRYPDNFNIYLCTKAISIKILTKRINQYPLKMVKIQRRHCFISSSDLLQFKTRKVQANNIVQIFWIKLSFSFPAESQLAHQLFPLCKAGWERRYFCLKTFQQTWQPRVFPRQLLWGQLLQTTAGKKSPGCVFQHSSYLHDPHQGSPVKC